MSNDHQNHVHVSISDAHLNDADLAATAQQGEGVVQADAFRSGGQTYEYGPRPHLSTPRPFDKQVDDAIERKRVTAMAYRLVAVSLLMKQQHQLAGLVVAREYCNEHGLDVYEIESELRSKGVPFGRSGLQVDATENGEAWFWRGRHKP